MSWDFQITRRRFIELAGVGAAGLTVSPLLSAPGVAASSGPNIVFILSDDQDWTGLSVSMDDRTPNSRSDFYRTPNLERLAAQGMRFSTAYAPSPVCSPTRYSLLTGKSPARLHWTKAAPCVTAEEGHKLVPPHIVRNISDSETTIAELLRTAGYATAHYGKWHLSGGGPGPHGFDEHDGDTDNRDAAPFVDPNPVDIFGITKRAAAFMEKHNKAGRPFYVQLSHHALHYPENARKATVEACRSRSAGRMHRDVQRAAITEDLDAGVGVLLSAIERLGIAGNTYVIYMSDNGGGGSQPRTVNAQRSLVRGRSRLRPLRGGKGSLWEGGIRVPLIIRGPGIDANTFCHVPVVGYDLLPTFCELAGIGALPDHTDGGSLVPIFTSPQTGRVRRPSEELVWHFPHYQGSEGPHSAIRLGDYKLIRFYESGESRLFDLSTDLGETDDISARQPDTARLLLQRLEEHLRDAGAQMPTPNPRHDPNSVPKPRRRPPDRAKRRRER